MKLDDVTSIHIFMFCCWSRQSLADVQFVCMQCLCICSRM